MYEAQTWGSEKQESPIKAILERTVSKIVLLVEHECVRFPNNEAQKEWISAR